ncbi:MAG: M42 family metallopeptidase [Ruminococcaceae bacterium]|nr:M42 family metallopeptidase [Oscillospiraceae bacterium]
MTESLLNKTLDLLRGILAQDSPVGFTKKAVDFSLDALRGMGYEPTLTRKGGVLCCLGGKDAENGLILSAHIDTLGGMVSRVKDNGRLKLSPVGGLEPNNIETESVRVYTRRGDVYEGTIQLVNASMHVNGSYRSTQRTYDTIECVLDEDVHSADEVRALGIDTGCFVCVEPRTVITKSGYIKSRFLDDKLSAAILLGFASYLKEEKIIPERQIWLHLTVYEEEGHGASATMPAGVTEILGVDMGCVGDELQCTEKEVSICPKDSSGPYNYEMTCRLISLAEEKGIGHAVDVYPHYSSDCSYAIRTFDVKHALIGPGVYASHGYERSHVDAVKSTFDLLCAYTEV